MTSPVSIDHGPKEVEWRLFKKAPKRHRMLLGAKFYWQTQRSPKAQRHTKTTFCHVPKAVQPFCQSKNSSLSSSPVLCLGFGENPSRAGYLNHEVERSPQVRPQSFSQLRRGLGSVTFLLLHLDLKVTGQVSPNNTTSKNHQKKNSGRLQFGQGWWPWAFSTAKAIEKTTLPLRAGFMSSMVASSSSMGTSLGAMRCLMTNNKVSGPRHTTPSKSSSFACRPDTSK